MSEKSFLEKLSPFELSLYLQKEMPKKPDRPWLDAGRGNPNWTAPAPREAFFLLGEFTLQEMPDLRSKLSAGKFDGSKILLSRLETFLKAHPGRGADFIFDVWQHGVPYLKMSFTSWLKAFLDAIIGDNYPNPVRCLPFNEAPLKAYLKRELYQNSPEPFDVFATEGGAAGICYVFDTLVHNFLLHRGDRIALMLPTFAPYLELPKLSRYQFDVLKIKAERHVENGKLTYTYSSKNLDQLSDPSVKAVFIVNPNNPTANALNAPNVQQLKEIVSKRPDLMILSDDVYGTFVKGFRSLFAELPYNTLSVYSFSKYFGATGWRLGTITVARHNVFDHLIATLSSQEKAALAQRYGSLTPDVAKIKLIDRLSADSRDIALHHAGGLSTPQQAMMSLFSLYGLLHDGAEYRREVQAICQQREQILFTTLQLPLPDHHFDSAYYCDLDLKLWLTTRFGADFAQQVTQRWTPTELVVLMAQREQIRLLKAFAVGSSAWEVRISLANLATSDYQIVGGRLVMLFTELKKEIGA